MALDIKKFFRGIKLLNNADPSNSVELSLSDSFTGQKQYTFPNTGPDGTQEVVTTEATQTLTDKTIDGDDNTVQDLALTSLKTDLANANKVLQRDAAGVVVNGPVIPAGSGDIVRTDSTQTLTNKTIDADLNTITNIENADIKAGAAIDATKIADGSVTNSEFQYLGGVTSDIQTQIDGKVAKAGDTMAGTLNMSNNLITNVATPVSAGDAVNKQYADDISAGLDPKAAVRVGTTGPVGGTYATSPSNGQITGAATSIDGISLTVADRVLIKDQADPLQNGIYTYTAAGEYTRSSDMDGTPSAEVSAGNYTFVTQGTLNAGKGYTLLGNGVLTLNTDPLNWTEFSGSQNAALRDLSNLTTTAINASLTPDTNATYNIGTLAARWLSIFANTFNLPNAGALTGRNAADSVDYDLAKVDGTNVAVFGNTTIPANVTGLGVALNSNNNIVDVRGTGATTSVALRLHNTANTQYAGIKADPAMAGNVTWTLPGTDGGSGQVLSTNGTGTLSWVNAYAGPTISGSRGAPNNITTSGITTGNFRTQVIFVQGSGGPVTITTTPAISKASSLTGDLLYVIGESDTNTLTINNQLGNVELNGQITLGFSDVLQLVFDGTAWVEISRNN